MRGRANGWILAAALGAMLVQSGCRGCEDGSKTQTGSPAGDAAPAAAASPTPAAAAAEVDCFVIVDAEPDIGSPPLEVAFETEVDCTAQPVTYRWDFGDGTTGGNQPNPTHSYAKPGDYVATVTVTAPDGGVGEDEIDITVDEAFGD